jgi:signal recognition particle subunit SEC65
MPDHVYVYPAYLGKGLTRKGGRRLPEADAVADVTVEEIAAAAKRLGLKAEIESSKQYPRRFFAYEGRVKVSKRAATSKGKLLRAIAVDVRRHRPAGKK